MMPTFPTILTTINSKRGGEIFKQVQAVFPDQKPIDRTFINSLEDRRVVEAVKNTGRKKLVISALWSEMCLAQPAIHAMGDGHDVSRRHRRFGRRLSSSILAGNTYKAFEMAPKVLAGIVNVNSPTVNDEIHAPMASIPSDLIAGEVVLGEIGFQILRIQNDQRIE